MFIKISRALLLVIVGLGTNLANGQNLITNGSFETPKAHLEPGWIEIISGNSFPGWTVNGNNAVDITAGEHGVPWTNIPDGIQAIDLNGLNAAGIYQDVTTFPGTAYNLKFYLSSNPACNPPMVKIQVSFEGKTVSQPTFNTSGNTLANMRWDVHNYVVSATSNLSRLEFTSQTFDTSCGPVIDAIELTPVVAVAQYLDVTPIPDVDNDNKEDQALLVLKSGKYYLLTISSATGKQLKLVSLGSSTIPTDLSVVNGQISILSVKPDNTSILQLRNSATGAVTKTINLPK